MKIRYVVLIVCALIVPASAMAAEAEQKSAAVERYFELAPVETLMREMMPQAVSSLPEARRDAAAAELLENLNFKRLEARAKKHLGKHLTLEELNAFIAFMEDPAGRSALSKMKFYMADLMPTVENELRMAFVKSQKRKERELERQRQEGERQSTQ